MTGLESSKMSWVLKLRSVQWWYTISILRFLINYLFLSGVSGALMGVMGSRYKGTGKVFPAGVVSLVSLAMAGGYLHGIMRSLH